MLKRTIFFSSPVRLSLQNQQMLVRPKTGGEVTIPIEDVGYTVLEHQEVSATLPLLNALVENNVAVVLCDQKHMPSSMLLNLDGHSVQQEVFSFQINAPLPLKKSMWKQTVEAKIKNQAGLLKKLGLENQDLLKLSQYVKSGDSTNREGAAARIYWSRLFGKNFIRDRNGKRPNMLLNYGYIVLRAAVARALAGSGLLATLGIFHKNRYNSFCLADDVMEPYRPFVDEIVYRIFLMDTTIDSIQKDHKRQLLEVLTEDVMMGKNKRPLMVALSQTTASMVRCFAKTSQKIIYPSLPRA
ncbi:MAG: type II CRISPR-associated endonuclease Cas1 [Bacteroidales bacterium]